MSAQTITSPSGERLVVLPEEEYRALQSAADDLEDGRAVHAFRRRLEGGEEELVPDAVVARLLAGDNPVRVWREHRGMRGTALAEAAGISQGYLSEIETGKKEGGLSAMKRIADVLQVDLDDLV